MKLAVDESFELPELDDTVEGACPGESVEKTTYDVYYDTSDLRLARWGCTMRHRQGKGWTVKLPVESKGRVVARDEIDLGARARADAARIKRRPHLGLLFTVEVGIPVGQPSTTTVSLSSRSPREVSTWDNGR